jgi:uncharacterized protein (DUF1697 family)
MQKYISILRGINVGGHKMIKMDALRKMYEMLDFSDVKTYIQSGNVVFVYKKTNCEDLQNKIAENIVKTFSFDVPVMVKEAEDIVSVLENNPFVNDRNEDEKTLHVTFLSEIPDTEAVEKIKNATYGGDEFVIVEKTIYLYCINSYHQTKLSNNFFENKLKVTATTRNWKTVCELAKIAVG